MPLQGRVAQAPAGVIGFDVTDPLNPATAKQYLNKGYQFCIRYLSHDKSAKSSFVDLTMDEAQIILDAGLALSVVQHPLKAPWCQPHSSAKRLAPTLRRMRGMPVSPPA